MAVKCRPRQLCRSCLVLAAVFLVWYHRSCYSDLCAMITTTPSIPSERRFPMLCNTTFEPTLRGNIDRIMRYPTADIEYLKPLGLVNISTDNVDYPEFPVIVTASSVDHFWESLGLVQTIHDTLLPKYSSVKVIYYDLGLPVTKRFILEMFCVECEIRTFDFELYPSHVRHLIGYAWKPIIIQSVLKEYPFIMWTDSSVRFKKRDLSQVIDNAKREGIQINIHKTDTRPVAERTDLDTFNFFGEDPCLFETFQEVSSGWILLVRSNIILRAIMRPWVSCALTFGCMVTNNSGRLKYECDKPGHYAGKCHRFDQSALGIIVTRLFNVNRGRITDQLGHTVGKINRDGGEEFVLSFFYIYRWVRLTFLVALLLAVIVGVSLVWMLVRAMLRPPTRKCIKHY